MKKFFTVLVAAFFALSLNAQTVDFSVDGFADADNNPIEVLNLGMDEGLSPRVIITNNGPDVIAASDTLYLDITFDGMEVGSLYLPGGNLADFAAGASTVLYMNGNLFEAADMDAQGFTDFEIGYTARIGGVSVDPVADNNTATIMVHRGNTGIENVANNEPAVYPNPASNYINIANAENATVTLFDLSGRVVLSENVASNQQTLDVSSLSKGLYLLRIQEGNNVVTKKVSIVK